MFWELEPENRDKWETYRFLDNVERHERHNTLANIAGKEQLVLVLDGQQRLIALNIGLKGFYETKRKWMRWNNPKAWVQRRLYLDLLRDPQPTEDDRGRFDARLEGKLSGRAK